MVYRIFNLFVITAFLGSLIAGIASEIWAQPLLGLPEPGVMVNLSPTYAPPLIKGVKVYPDIPLGLILSWIRATAE
jgi:hypothetical protein